MQEDLAQEQLQNALVTTYLANLVFLSEYDNDLYKRIESLSKEIEENRYKERYYLEFLKDHGEFDIYDNKHDKYLYNKKARKYNNQAIDSINFDSKGQFINLQEYHFSSHKKYDIGDGVINNPSDSMKLVLNDIQEFVEVLKDDLSTVKSRKTKNIEKFVFIGTLLSRHMIGIVNKTQAKHYFVCEGDLEIFRLSLFVFDYTLLTQNDGTVVFSIMDDDYIFPDKYRLFHQNNAQFNHTIKYFSTNYNVEKYFDLIFDGMISNSSFSFDYQRVLRNVVNLSFSRINNRNILCSKLRDVNKESFLKDKPALYVGAGPSFLDNIEWIKENQNFFIIVAMGATFEKLIDYGIRVDVICNIDPSYEVIEKLQFNEVSMKKIKDQLIVLSVNTHDKIEEKFNKDNLFEFLIMKNLHKEAELQSGYSVGETITALLLQIGIEELYLVGLDFSINKDTGNSHSIGTSSSTKLFNLNNIKSSIDKENFSLSGDLFKVKGNNNNTVYTNRLYNMSLNTLSSALKQKSFESKKVYNMSKTGAYIENTKEFSIDNFKNKSYKELDLNTLAEDLRNDFLTISKNTLSKEDKNNLTEEKEYLHLIQKELDVKNKLDINNYKEFQILYSKTLDKFIYNDSKTSFLEVLFKNYLEIVFSYIDYSFNDKKIKKEKEKIKNIRLILTKQLNNMIEIYISYLDKGLK